MVRMDGSKVRMNASTECSNECCSNSCLVLFSVFYDYLVGLCFFCFDYFYQGKELKFIDNSKIIPVIKITNNEIFRFLKIDNKYSENLSSEIKKKSDLLFEKSIDSKLRIKKNSKNQENIYNESGRKNIENIIENNLE